MDTSHSLQHQTESRMTLSAAFPAGAVAETASHDTVNMGQIAGPEAEIKRSADQGPTTSGKMEGKQIFAIRYRVIRLKGKGVKEETIFGEVKTTNYESGAYDHEDAEPVLKRVISRIAGARTTMLSCQLNRLRARSNAWVSKHRLPSLIFDPNRSHYVS